MKELGMVVPPCRKKKKVVINQSVTEGDEEGGNGSDQRVGVGV